MFKVANNAYDIDVFSVFHLSNYSVWNRSLFEVNSKSHWFTLAENVAWWL